MLGEDSRKAVSAIAATAVVMCTWWCWCSRVLLPVLLLRGRAGWWCWWWKEPAWLLVGLVGGEVAWRGVAAALSQGVLRWVTMPMNGVSSTEMARTRVESMRRCSRRDGEAESVRLPLRERSVVGADGEEGREVEAWAK